MAQLRFTFVASFIDSLTGLPKQVHSRFVKCLKLFARDRTNPGLNVKRLSGKASSHFSARVDLEWLQEQANRVLVGWLNEVRDETGGRSLPEVACGFEQEG